MIDVIQENKISDSELLLKLKVNSEIYKNYIISMSLTRKRNSIIFKLIDIPHLDLDDDDLERLYYTIEVFGRKLLNDPIVFH